MPTTSTLVDVEAALVALLTAYPWPRAVRVDAAFPGEDRLERDHVFIGDASGTHSDAAMKAGRRWRDETYTVDVVVWALRPGGSPSEAKADAVELWGGVENVVADNPTLGVEGVIGAEVGDWTVNLVSQPNGAACQIVVSVEVSARIT